MKKTGAIESLIELASSQWGLFTSAQALDVGVSRTQLSRMVADGRVESTSYAAYRLTAGEETAHCGVKSAWLSLFPKLVAHERLKARPRDAVVACGTAAHMHGDTELHEEPYVFAVESGKRTTRNDVELHAWHIDERDIVVIEGLPVTTVERTVADLVRTSSDPSLVGNFVIGACARGHVVDEGRLADLLSPLAARNGYAKGDGESFARRLVSDYADPGQMRLATDAFTRALEASPSYREMTEQMAEALRAATEAMPAVQFSDFSQLPAMKAISRLQVALEPYRKLSADVAQALRAVQPSLEVASRVFNSSASAALEQAAAFSVAQDDGCSRGGGECDEVQDA